MIYFNNLQGRDYNRAYGETVKCRVEGDDPIIFDLYDNQITNAMNEDWQYVTKGQMAMVIQGRQPDISSRLLVSQGILKG